MQKNDVDLILAEELHEFARDSRTVPKRAHLPRPNGMVGRAPPNKKSYVKVARTIPHKRRAEEIDCQNLVSRVRECLNLVCDGFQIFQVSHQF